MKLPRRKFLHMAVGAAALPALPHIAQAQAYPTRPVRLIVGSRPGSPSADAAFVITQMHLSERLGQPFVLDSRPGAAGNVATEAVVRANADGYTLLLVNAAHSINATLYENLNFNFIRDIALVGIFSRGPQVMVVNPSVPAKTVPEFIAYAKANPGKINFASGRNGTLSHLSGELFKMMAGVNMVHVSNRGGAPALTDLLDGRAQVMFTIPREPIEYIKAGKLRALATTGATRSKIEPILDMPTVAEFVPGYEASAFFGLGAPKNTPAEIVDRLNKEINAFIEIVKIGDPDAEEVAGSPADFGKLIAEQTEKWAKVIKFAGLKPD